MKKCPVIILAFLLIAAAPAMAYRFEAAPVTGETITLFGQLYSVNGVNVMTEAWQGAGGLENNCGMAVGFRQGADPSLDEIYLSDECDSGGEDIAILTGVDPVTFQPSAAVTTSSYIVNAAAGGNDPSGIEWITDSGTMNFRVPLGVSFQMIALDASGIPYADYSTTSDSGDYMSYKGIGACKNAKDASATRMYYGGVIGAPDHFAVGAFDLTTNSFVNGNSILLDGIGTPDTEPSVNDRALRELAFDGYYFYALVKQPGVDENWLYRYSSMPDPPGTGDFVHPETPLGVQLDSTPGLAWTTANRADRTGIACGRNVNIGGTWWPTFYVLADQYLYTLKPIEEAHPDPGFDNDAAWCFLQFNGAGTGGTAGGIGSITHPGGGGQGGILFPCNQIAGLVTGQNYTVTVDRNYTALGNSAVAELWVGDDPNAYGGSDYPGPGQDTSGGILKDDCWGTACGSTGGFAPMPQGPAIGNPWTYSSGNPTWFVLKVSGWGPGSAQTVEFDNASIQGVLDVSDWMLY